MKKENEVVKEILGIIYRDGVCTPQALVEVAADPKSPLHHRFEWDDTIAGQRWREQQARLLIGSFTIEVGGTRTPAFTHVTITNGNTQQGYVNIETAMNDEGLRAQIFEEARRGLAGWRNRLAAFQEASEAGSLLTQAIEALSE